MHRPLRRLATSTALSLLVVVALAVPAWAAPSFSTGAEATAGDAGHTATLQVPDDEQIGATASVTVTAPNGFAPSTSGCFGPVGWSCAVEGRRITYTRGSLGQLGTTFGFQVAVPTAAGAYPFRIDQRDAEGGSIAWTAGSGAPVMTVVAGEGGEGGEGGGDGDGGDGDSDGNGDTATPGGGGTGSTNPTPGSGDGATDNAPTDDTSSPPATPAPAPSTAAPTAPPTEAPDDGTSTSSSGGSTAPTRTQGRSSGTTLEVVPGAPAADDDPAIAAPDVAEQPAVAAPAAADGEALDGETAAAGTTGDAPGDRPWQQVLGAALLGVGAVTLGVRQWRSR